MSFLIHWMTTTCSPRIGRIWWFLTIGGTDISLRWDTHTDSYTNPAKPAGPQRVFIKVPVLTCSLHLHQHANHHHMAALKSGYEKCQFGVSLKQTKKKSVWWQTVTMRTYLSWIPNISGRFGGGSQNKQTSICPRQSIKQGRRRCHIWRLVIWWALKLRRESSKRRELWVCFHLFTDGAHLLCQTPVICFKLA